MTQGELRLRSEQVEWRTVEDEVVALTLTDDRYLGANRTGALLWKALSRGTSFADLVRILVDEGATTEQAERDSAQFVSQLRERGLLEG